MSGQSVSITWYWYWVNALSPYVPQRTLYIKKLVVTSASLLVARASLVVTSASLRSWLLACPIWPIRPQACWLNQMSDCVYLGHVPLPLTLIPFLGGENRFVTNTHHPLFCWYFGYTQRTPAWFLKACLVYEPSGRRIPPDASGHDVSIQSETGSGKTLVPSRGRGIDEFGVI